jgi:hypothetical protein
MRRVFATLIAVVALMVPASSATASPGPDVFCKVPILGNQWC